MNEQTRLSLYKKSLQSAWGYNDYNDWPIKVNSVMHIFLKEFAKEFIEDMEEITKRGLTAEEVANAFGNPARFYRLIDPVIFGMKRMKISITKQREFVLRLLDIVKEMKYGSEFNENEKNLILSPEEINNLSCRMDYKKAEADEATIIQRFCGVMWSYTESIFFRAHEVTKEIHGAYEIDNGEKLIIREYLNLQPYEIWKDVPFVHYKNIKIFSKYKSDLNVSIDSYNHLFLHGGNYVNDLVEYFIEADDKQISVEQLQDIIPQMQKCIETVHAWVGKADWYTRVNKYADIYWYRKSPLRTLVDKDWRVPQEIRDKIMAGEADPKRLNNLSDEWIDRLIRIVI
jgi:hypothetical protein